MGKKATKMFQERAYSANFALKPSVYREYDALSIITHPMKTDSYGSTCLNVSEQHFGITNQYYYKIILFFLLLKILTIPW